MPWSLLLVPISLVLIFLYFRARQKNDLMRIAWLQPSLTLLSILIALLALNTPAVSVPYTLTIAFALVIATVGDINNVDMADPDVVMRGLIIFCFAYLAYGVGFTVFSGFHRADFVVGIVLLLLYGLFVAYEWTDAREMRGPLMIYAAIMFFMVWRGIGTFFSDAFSITQAALLSAGSAALLAGDFEFSVHLFKRPLRTMAGPALYGGGQLLIALSCSFAP